jgi:hypothetical protein
MTSLDNFCSSSGFIVSTFIHIRTGGTEWCENSTRWKSCKQARARGRGAWACLAHGLQCLCDERACCSVRALQLVICRS